MPKRRSFYLFLIVYFFSALQFVRFYVKSTVFYLNMPAYLSGHERLPFQERVLPVVLLRPLYNSAWIVRHLAHAKGPLNAETGPFYLLSLLSLIIAATYTQRLYHLVSARRSFSFLVFPIFLYTVMWTYTIHTEANFSYPYDFPSLAFFAAGLYYIFSRRYISLLMVVLLGTFNRETTLFLIAIYAVNAAAPSEAGSNFNLRCIPWLRTALLSGVWLTIKLALAHHFAANDASEQILRVHDNFHQLKPRLVPALLNICGYTMPLILIFHKKIESVRFRYYLWIVPAWFLVMFCSGVLVETRIYGELCSYSAVAIVLMLESFIPHTQPDRQSTAIYSYMTQGSIKPKAKTPADIKYP